jgi:hypothetical protein
MSTPAIPAPRRPRRRGHRAPAPTDPVRLVTRVTDALRSRTGAEHAPTGNGRADTRTAAAIAAARGLWTSRAGASVAPEEGP